MYPNNIFIYKSGAIRQESKIYPEDWRSVREVEQVASPELYFDEINDACLYPRQLQRHFYRYKLPNLNVWIEE